MTLYYEFSLTDDKTQQNMFTKTHCSLKNHQKTKLGLHLTTLVNHSIYGLLLILTELSNSWKIQINDIQENLTSITFIHLFQKARTIVRVDWQKQELINIWTNLCFVQFLKALKIWCMNFNSPNNLFFSLINKIRFWWSN